VAAVQDELEADVASSPASRPRGFKRPAARAALQIGAALLLALAIYAGIRWLVHGRFIESTDDAYLRADLVTIAPRVSGYIDELYVTENQKVEAGQPLLRIDRRNYRDALSQRTATVDARIADVKALQSQIEQQEAAVAQSRAQLAGAQANAEFAEHEATRYKGLRDAGAETDERYAQAVNERNQARAAALAAAASLRVAERQVATLKSQMTQMQAQLEAARAAASTAQVDLEDTLVRASISGRIGDDTARLGQFVQPGTRLMSIVPVSRIYLVANFKETQLRHMRVGQPARIRIDALGEQELDGRIESFAPGTGAQFALLPPENATGNFIKIVQRVPVRLRLDVPPQLADRLLPGLSATVSVDTSR
jgi:membrane fusion protein, multidrug efflux system